jgi:hypothetical protein
VTFAQKWFRCRRPRDDVNSEEVADEQGALDSWVCLRRRVPIGHEKGYGIRDDKGDGRLACPS